VLAALVALNASRIPALVPPAIQPARALRSIHSPRATSHRRARTTQLEAPKHARCLWPTVQGPKAPRSRSEANVNWGPEVNGHTLVQLTDKTRALWLPNAARSPRRLRTLLLCAPRRGARGRFKGSRRISRVVRATRDGP
jgi:hypothetical protein